MFMNYYTHILLGKKFDVVILNLGDALKHLGEHEVEAQRVLARLS